ncbi:MAG: DNA replication and repair protein RecF [Candidatus Gracilibacteria bacterium]|nr:DNA replication and repair protein RecF [Candidatus Gracilibacteria bacterium]MDQ7023115.1 DNA replication and repair protein RecF [Candidatus Gracilibacteria bacterium]
MIKKLKLVNFRNFQNREFFFSDNKNYIIGENGKGKTNILEALSLLTGNSITGINFENLVKSEENFFHIEIENFKESNLVIFFDKENNKKKYSINKKNTSKNKFNEISLKSVVFSPTTMNIFHLGPSLRRDFLDNILFSSFPEYDKVLKTYKQSLLNRNKVLKNISKKKSEPSEIKFWDTEFIKNSMRVYKYRKIIINFLINNSMKLTSSFNGKIKKIEFNYISKIDNLDVNIEKYLQKYLKENLEKEIILRTTTIGPHRDDFELIIDGKTNLVDFASRGETKTTILGLKNLEIQFIEEKTNRKPILIIDDLLSELDENHKNIFINSIEGYQTFISGIRLEIKREGEGALIKL